MLSDKTMAYGEALTVALLGVDALYRQEPAGADEGLVVINMAAATHRPQAFATYADAAACFEDLQRRAAALPEPDRRKYYDQVCASTLAFILWRQGRLPFAGQLAGFLHVPAAPAEDAELDAIRSQLHALLNGMGYGGYLAAQCVSWEARHRVPPDEVLGVIRELADDAWERTAQRMRLPATKSDGMRFSGVTGAAFNARCNYLQRTVELNLDPVLTRQGLKHLVVHEGYPGHYVQFKLREEGYRRGTSPADGLLSVVNTASSTPFEGIADNGLRVIDWIESDDDRVNLLLGRYRAGLGTAAAWRLHALGWPEDQVRDWLRANAFTGGEGWVANRMRFITSPGRAVLIWSYWWGDASVAPVWEATPPERHRELLDYLYSLMHSRQTVAMFAQPEEL